MRRLGLILPLVGAASLVGCEIESEPLGWTAIDAVALEVALDNPDGHLTSDAAYRVNFVVNTSLDVILALEEIVTLIERALLGAPRRRAEGGAVFVRVACPGPNLREPDTSYDAGELRIELDADFDLPAARVTVPGDALIEASGCTVGTWRADGASPAYVDVGAGRLLLDAGFRLDGPGGGQIGFPVRARDGTLEWQVFLDGHAFTVALDRATLDTVEVRGANGVWRCSLAFAEDPCVPQ